MKSIRDFYLVLESSRAHKHSALAPLQGDQIFAEVIQVDRLRTRLMASIPPQEQVTESVQKIVQRIVKACQHDARLLKRKQHLENHYVNQLLRGVSYIPSKTPFPEMNGLTGHEQSQVIHALLLLSLQEKIENYLQGFCSA